MTTRKQIIADLQDAANKASHAATMALQAQSQMDQRTKDARIVLEACTQLTGLSARLSRVAMFYRHRRR